jgi:hypothetical protein
LRKSGSGRIQVPSFQLPSPKVQGTDSGNQVADLRLRGHVLE